MDFERIKSLDEQYIMPTYARYDVALLRGSGSVVWDVDDKQYIDFGSGIGVNSLGYCESGWIEAITKQAQLLQHSSNLYYTLPQLRVAQRLCRSAGMDKVLFCNSGAEANECAIKLARKYSFDKYGKGRYEIITLYNSFHGRTITTLSATGQDVFHNYFFPFTEGFVYAKANDLEDLKAKLSDKTCGVFIELIQGEGGVVPLDKDYVKALEDVCRQKDILLIIDEVQTGIGRTGSLFAFQQYGVKPDIVTSAKGLGGGLPIGACLCAEKLAETLNAGTHGTTYGGNPIACAGAEYVLSVVDNEQFLKSVSQKGEYIKSKISKFDGVKEVRGLGLMIGIVLKANSKEVSQKCLENGLLTLTAKDNLRLLPPLNITYEEIDKGLSILEAALKQMA